MSSSNKPVCIIVKEPDVSVDDRKNFLHVRYNKFTEFILPYKADQIVEYQNTFN